MPTRNLPDEFDVPYRLAPAPEVLAAPLLDAYRDAGTASQHALTAMAGIAARLQSPSHVLTTGRTTTAAKSGGSRISGWPRAAAPAARESLPVPPGPVERILLDLNVTDPDTLREAAALDTTASTLILRAAAGPHGQQPRAAADLSRSAGTAEVINDLLATRGDQIPAPLRPAPGTGPRGRTAGKLPKAKVLRVQLPASLTSARRARVAVRKALSAWGLDQLTDDCELLASELVGNAAEHNDGKPILLTLARQAGPAGQHAIRCEITDTSPRLPRPRDAAPDSERGRGLAIVAALATEHGIRATRGRKTTWFTLTTATEPERRAARQAQPELEAGT